MSGIETENCFEKDDTTIETNEATTEIDKMDERLPVTQTITVEQQCQNLSYLFAQARSKKNSINYLKAEIELPHEKFPIYQPAGLEQLKENLEAAEREHQSLLGETTLITCPVLNCKTHNHPKINSKTINQVKKSLKNKRSDAEEFQLPRKTARITKEIPLNQVICTTNNKFAVLDCEQTTNVVSDPPTQAKIKPIMMKITKNYNLILQDINRKYPTTVNKVTGDWIKFQCTTSDDHREITTTLVDKKD
ncbi:hypothetical protein TNCT_620691 [Trichonephila clavata]|uniref:Uncharacterized protein n=1 Tax=Trichonephila clavata TaxID=2740835 RepID=A0A8X6FKV2_TRICU|nr:hypothetical protein TNCT_620691 [Trichonephila clavata]